MQMIGENYRKIHKENRILKFFGKLIWTFIIVTISIVLYDMYRNIKVDSVETIEEKTTGEIQANETNENEKIYLMLEDVSQTIVGVSKLQSVDSSFFSLEAVKKYNLGTGVIISKKGYVLTNNHITGGKLSKCYINTEEGKEYNATVVWSDENLDLSILKVSNTREMNSAILGDSEKIKIGQSVYAIGNPLGVEFERTVTNGIISALDRTIKIEEEEKVAYMENLIQTDASINSGNSGGPLIDENGKVIGITTIKIAEAEGIGFAVPINIIKPIIERLEETGTYEEASLGVLALDKEAIQYINTSLEFDYGIYVTDIINGGAAKKAGVKQGDIIKTVDGIELNKINDLRKYIYTKNIGEEVTLKILREKNEIEIKVKLAQKK